MTQVTVHVIDGNARQNLDDDATTCITLTVSPSRVSEGASPTTVTVTATVNGGATYREEQTVAVSVAGALPVGWETALANDFKAVPDFNIQVLAGDTRATKTFDLTLVNDDVAEEDETLTVSGTFGEGATATAATLTIVDNDTAGVTVSLEQVVVTEAAGPGYTAIYTMVLNSKPLRDVTITPTSNAPTVATVSGPLRFTPENWN